MTSPSPQRRPSTICLLLHVPPVLLGHLLLRYTAGLNPMANVLAALLLLTTLGLPGPLPALGPLASLRRQARSLTGLHIIAVLAATVAQAGLLKLHLETLRAAVETAGVAVPDCLGTTLRNVRGVLDAKPLARRLSGQSGAHGTFDANVFGGDDDRFALFLAESVGTLGLVGVGGGSRKARSEVGGCGNGKGVALCGRNKRGDWLSEAVGRVDRGGQIIERLGKIVHLLVPAVRTQTRVVGKILGSFSRSGLVRRNRVLGNIVGHLTAVGLIDGS